MGKIIKIASDDVYLSGRVKLSAWRPGVISYLMDKGMSLDEAMGMARHLGALDHEIETHNLTTTIGLQFSARLWSKEELVGLQYFAIGTGTTPPTINDSALANEYMRKVLTECYQGDIHVYSTVFLLASECSIHIKEGGLFGGAAALSTPGSGYLVCRFLLDDDNSVNQFDLTLQHTANFGFKVE